MRHGFLAVSLVLVVSCTAGQAVAASSWSGACGRLKRLAADPESGKEHGSPQIRDLANGCVGRWLEELRLFREKGTPPTSKNPDAAEGLEFLLGCGIPFREDYRDAIPGALAAHRKLTAQGAAGQPSKAKRMPELLFGEGTATRRLPADLFADGLDGARRQAVELCYGPAVARAGKPLEGPFPLRFVIGVGGGAMVERTGPQLFDDALEHYMLEQLALPLPLMAHQLAGATGEVRFEAKLELH